MGVLHKDMENGNGGLLRSDLHDHREKDGAAGVRHNRAGFVANMMPSFLVPKEEPAEPPTLRPTAYLDGLRGIAAWAVVNNHLSILLTKGYGSEFSHDGNSWPIYQLPIIRTILHGEFAVALFFVISGFALSIGPVAAMSKSPREPDKFMRKLASTVFRRPMRLFIPAWISCIFAFLVVRTGVFENIRAQRDEYDKYILGWAWGELGKWTKQGTTFFQQLWECLVWNFDLFSVYLDSTDGKLRHIPFNAVLWTIKLEFRSSMVLYLTHAAVYFMDKSRRTIIICGLITLGVAKSNFDFPLFWAGYLLAEHSRWSKSLNSTSVRHHAAQVGMWLVFLFGLYLGSMPSWDAEHTPDFAWLLRLTPFNYAVPDRFWISVGAVMAVWAIPRVPLILKFFNSALLQYLGKISFSLYLVHFVLTHSWGMIVFKTVWSLTGQANALTTLLGFVLAYSFHLFCMVWVADVFWRFVDIPSNSFGQTVERWMFTAEY